MDYVVSTLLAGAALTLLLHLGQADDDALQRMPQLHAPFQSSSTPARP